MQKTVGDGSERTLELVALQPDGWSATPPAQPSPHSLLLQQLGRRKSWLICVVLPTVLAGLYYGLLAADRYEAESRFVVRSPSAAATSQLASLMQGSSIVRSADDAHIVHAYVESRDAVRSLAAEIDLMGMLARPGVDLLWRYPGILTSPNQERLWKHMQDLVSVTYDQTTGISTLRVQAFSPDDAKTIADTLLRDAELLINRLSERAQADAVRGANREVEASRARALETHAQLTAFRNRNSIVDPTRVSTASLENITRLVLEAAQTNAQLAELQQASPQSPQANPIRLRIAALNAQILAERRELAGTDNSLAPLIAEYERLVFEREFAERTFTLALNALEVAHAEAQRQRLFLERINAANALDPKYPYRLLSIFGVFVFFSLLHRTGRKIVGAR